MAPIDSPDFWAEESASTHAPAAIQTLKNAMRRARVDDAERAGVSADLRAARIGRLEILQDALKPLVAQIPNDVDFFDVALMPGASPRLFIDMIGFVEMGRDGRVYHFLQDTRHGRVKLAEGTDVDTMVDAITDYVARRLLERDKALAADAIESRGVARGTELPPPKDCPSTPSKDQAIADGEPTTRPRKALGWAGIGFAFLIDLLGSIAFFSILAGLGWVLWNKLHG